MTITSLGFIAFLMVLFLVFYICPVKFRWVILLLGSILFYVLAGAVEFLPFIILTSFVVWFSALRISRLYGKQEHELQLAGTDKAQKKQIRQKYKKKAKLILVLALFVSIGILVLTKFANYVAQYMEDMAGINALASGAGETPAASPNVFWVLIPLGISYYTFSTVGYLLDVYWKRYRCERNFLRFFLYAIYFPHIIQGPISRYNLLGQELKKELRFDSRRIVFGMELMLWGFFKKLVIADRLNIIVTAVYDGQVHSGSVFLIAMIFDVLQLYTDFSGYTDIVRGASQVFGVELEQNFNHPFFSRSVPEFWRRWHMTLGGWFKDYVYYPCSISSVVKFLNKKVKKMGADRLARFIVVVIPVFITWILTGLWHGTGMDYLYWGLYYSTLITISTAFQPEFKKVNELLHINTDTFSWRLFQQLRTFCLFMGGRLLTRPGSFENSRMMLEQIKTDFQIWQLVDGTLATFGVPIHELVLLGICFLILWAVSMMQERFSVREKLAEQNIIFRWIILYTAIFSIVIFGIYGFGYDAAAFIYSQY